MALKRSVKFCIADAKTFSFGLPFWVRVTLKFNTDFELVFYLLSFAQLYKMNYIGHHILSLQGLWPLM